MGWLWSSTSSPVAPADGNALDPTSQSSASSPTPSPSAPLTRDEIAEKELQSFLNELEADAKPSSTKYNRVRKQPPPPSPSSSELPISEQILPRTMRCRDAFDAAFYCNSLGGQFNNLYRYGTVRSCSENWNDFWFCMRTRGYGKKEKEEAIMARYREKEKMRYGRGEGEEGMVAIGKSSEDVWRSRERKMEWGTAFCEPVTEFKGDDEEWNRREKERRGRVADGTMKS